MKRLNQLVTRLLILALIALAAWVGREYLGKQAMVYHLQSYVGARVDAKRLHLGSENSTVFLDQIEIASPLGERENLLQFEAASLKLDLGELKNRRVVIEDGRLSEVKFGAARTTSGRLTRSIFDPFFPTAIGGKESARQAGIPMSSDIAASYPLAQRWRDSLVVDMKKTTSAPSDASFEVGPLMNQKSKLWAERFREPNSQMAAVNESLTKVEEILSVPIEEQNPLRTDDRLKEANDQINASLESLKRVGTLIAQFESQSQKDMYELSQVQLRDRRSLTSKNLKQKFDVKLVNELLVGDVQRQLVANGIGWFQQFRTSLPNPETDFRPIKRGRDIMFGKTIKPNLEIQKLQIDGSTEFANSHFKFAGTVENVFDDPTASELPLKFNLRAQGDPQVVVSGTVDRTAGRKVDSIQFTGLAIPQPAYTLGSEDSIQLSMTDSSRLHVDAILQADEFDRISGTITFTFEGVILHADSIHQVAGGAETAARLNETVSGIQSFQVVSQLGGTIAKPTTAFVSDLGKQVASSLESVFMDAQLLASRKREHQFNKTIDGGLVQFKENVSGSIAKLNESWRSSYSRLNQLREQISVAQGPRFSRPTKRR